MRIKCNIKTSYYDNAYYHKKHYSEIIVQFRHYKNNVYDGEVKEWWCNNGQLIVHCYYKNDNLHGKYQEWYNNGQLRLYYFFKNNKLDGECVEYNEDGTINEHAIYKNDKKVKEI